MISRVTNHILIVQKIRIRRMALIVCACILTGLAYPIVDKEFSNPLAFLNGFLIGLLGGLAIAVHQDYRYFRKMKRQRFFLNLLKNVALYTFFFAIIVAVVVATTYGLKSDQGLLEYATGLEYQSFIFHGDYVIIVFYALFFCGVISFTLIMSRKIEARVMFNLITGKYRKPVEEVRIFMAIDLNNSTEIAEELGEEAYFEFINKFYFDLTPAIIATNGQIYRYVGDQVLISWPLGTVANNSLCLRTYTLAKNELMKKKEEYLQKWGFDPSFKAVFHAGSVVAGEVGDIKSQFVFHGKVLSQLALIEKQCASLGVSLLLSSKFIEQADLPPYYNLKKCSTLSVEDANNPIVLYTVTQLVGDPISETLQGQ